LRNLDIPQTKSCALIVLRLALVYLPDIRVPAGGTRGRMGIGLQMRRLGVVLCMVTCIVGGAACAAECPGNSDAIGTSRTIYVDPSEHPRIGTMQYHETLPLNDHEIVLTFDDGPLPPKTTHVLDILASQCVKATFFIIGKMATEFPTPLRRAYAEGHSIGTHTETHPLNLKRAPLPLVQTEVEGGIASVTAALGDPKALTPFFRIPGLERQNEIDEYLQARGLMTWSADFVADDWKHISAAEVYRRALSRIEAKHKGVLLLHDIQPATVAALPRLLAELKRRGYHIVHVAPATTDQPKTITEPSQWLTSSIKSEAPEIASLPEPRDLSAPTSIERPAPTSAAPASRVTVVINPLAAGTSQIGHPHTLVMRGPIPLPLERPRAISERSAHEKVPSTPNTRALLPSPAYIGHAGILPPSAAPASDDDHQILTTGSINTPAAKAQDDEPVLRPSAEIPAPKIQ
jgi:peptidoglycan-N-acetylglucosamine deacetylase